MITLDEKQITESAQAYQVIGAIQFIGGDINALDGGADQPQTAMYRLDMSKGATIAGHIDSIAGLLYQHAQERAQDSGQAVAMGLIKAEWAGEISGLYEDMLWYCAGPSVLAAEYDELHNLVQQWAAAPEAYSGVYVRHIGKGKAIPIDGGAILESAEKEVLI